MVTTQAEYRLITGGTSQKCTRQGQGMAVMLQCVRPREHGTGHAKPVGIYLSDSDGLPSAEAGAQPVKPVTTTTRTRLVPPNIYIIHTYILQLYSIKPSSLATASLRSLTPAPRRSPHHLSTPRMILATRPAPTIHYTHAPFPYHSLTELELSRRPHTL